MRRFEFLIAGAVSALVFFTGLGRADDSSTVQVKLKPSGFVSMATGEIVHGGPNLKDIRPVDGTWMRQFIGDMSVKALLSDRSSVSVGMEIAMYNNFPVVLGAQAEQQFRALNWYAYLSRAEYRHIFGDVNNPLLTFEAGYFPFKYNPDARDLGEYLFRTGTYPQFVNTDFDFPQARLAGVHAALHPSSNLTVDGLFYTNMSWYAIGDWNLAAIVTYAPVKGISLGLGGSLNSIISADSTQTTPHDQASAYHITYNETSGKRDTSFYTFRGAKAMAMASIDAKDFFGNMGCGKEDLELYSEAAILGLRDYPSTLDGKISYNDILQRIPVMVGVNLPTFKSIDKLGDALGLGMKLEVLSVQAEWFGSPYPNDMGGIVNSEQTLPVAVNTALGNYPDDSWKWSIYAKLDILRNYALTAQVANDHLRYLAAPTDVNVDFDEVTHNLHQWYYVLKFAAGF